MRHLIFLTACLAALPISAHAFTTNNSYGVAPVNEAVFEVVSRRGASSPRGFWCAAGQYAFSLGVRTNTRIYLVSGRQPSVTDPGRTAVRFTLAPEAAGITPINPQLSLSVDVPGDNVSVAAAREFCLTGGSAAAAGGR